MKIKSPQRSKIALTIAALALIGASVGVYVFLQSQQDSKKSDIVKQVEKDGQKTVEIKDRAIGDVNYDSPTHDEANPATDPLRTPPDQNATGPIPVSISYASGSPLEVRAVIKEILNIGTCTVTLEKSGQRTVSETVETFAAPSYTTCKGFEIDTSNLAKGQWKLTVIIKSGERTGSSTREVSI